MDFNDPEVRKDYNKSYYEQNKERLKQEARERRLRNIDRAKEVDKQYHLDNAEKRREYARQWRIANPEYGRRKARERNEKAKAEGSNFHLALRLRQRLYQAIKGRYKAGSAVLDLGCSIDEFRAHIEKQFHSGMTWENWGRNTWHLDHIKPLASFDLNDRDQFLAACHYTNYQPLLAFENLQKGKG